MVLLALLLPFSQSFAQQVGAGTCDVPVVVADYSNQLVRDLVPAEFSVSLAGARQPLDSASIDGGPKRIAIILDASENIPDDEWKLETEMAQSFVGNARPEDRFAFFVIGEGHTETSFLSANEVTARLQKLAGSRPTEKIYDALLSAVKRLDPPQFGDAIFLFGHHEDFGSEVDFDQIRERILRNKLRFYGMSFADPLKKLPPGFDLNRPTGLTSSKLESLSAETGYFFSFHAVHNLNQPGQMSLFKGFLSDLYAGIAEPYRLSIPKSGMKDEARLEVSVTNLEARRMHQDGIHYPHLLYPCAVPIETAP